MLFELDYRTHSESEQEEEIESLIGNLESFTWICELMAICESFTWKKYVNIWQMCMRIQASGSEHDSNFKQKTN